MRRTGSGSFFVPRDPSDDQLGDTAEPNDVHDHQHGVQHVEHQVQQPGGRSEAHRPSPVPLLQQLFHERQPVEAHKAGGNEGPIDLERLEHLLPHLRLLSHVLIHGSPVAGVSKPRTPQQDQHPGGLQKPAAPPRHLLRRRSPRGPRPSRPLHRQRPQ